LEKAGRVNSYFDIAYLMFFKSYKNDSYLLDAMGRNDVTSIEQVRNALSTSATEDLTKAGQLQPFDGDVSLRNALQQALKFYKMEANEKAQSYIDFLLAKDNFEKIKKSHDATPQNKKTQQQVDAYNKAVKDYNPRINAINAMNADMNKKRSAMLKIWNDASNDFLDKHTPTHK
jgi:hypothetical protein